MSKRFRLMAKRLMALAALTVSPALGVTVTLDVDSNSNVPNTDPGVTVVGSWSQSTSASGGLGAN